MATVASSLQRLLEACIRSVMLWVPFARVETAIVGSLPSSPATSDHHSHEVMSVPPVASPTSVTMSPSWTSIGGSIITALGRRITTRLVLDWAALPLLSMTCSVMEWLICVRLSTPTTSSGP